jgi:hypothetical protein
VIRAGAHTKSCSASCPGACALRDVGAVQQQQQQQQQHSGSPLLLLPCLRVQCLLRREDSITLAKRRLSHDDTGVQRCAPAAVLDAAAAEEHTKPAAVQAAAITAGGGAYQ